MSTTNKNTLEVDLTDKKHYVYMSIIDLLKEQSNCLGSKFGCVIVNPYLYGSMYFGFNGGQFKDDEDCGCQRCIKRANGEIKSGENLNECTCIHAEPRALMWVPSNFKDKHFLDLYVQGLPCIDCAHEIINTGYVGRVFIRDDYYLDKSKTDIVKELFKQNHIDVYYINNSE
jgi:deoxycytidylate deaminase